MPKFLFFILACLASTLALAGESTARFSRAEAQLQAVQDCVEENHAHLLACKQVVADFHKHAITIRADAGSQWVSAVIAYKTALRSAGLQGQIGHLDAALAARDRAQDWFDQEKLRIRSAPDAKASDHAFHYRAMTLRAEETLEIIDNASSAVGGPSQDPLRRAWDRRAETGEYYVDSTYYRWLVQQAERQLAKHAPAP